ncbi:MAG: helix-turn-helix domain-containing protein [Oscillospiraceae bacterium]|nr:helix-turn-helix domain-containing protein [Oscillospiraceae bacterium]
MQYQRLRDLREDADLTQEQVAKVLYMLRSVYQRYESGKREIPFNIAIMLAKFYNVSLDYIAGFTNIKKPPLK